MWGSFVCQRPKTRAAAPSSGSVPESSHVVMVVEENHSESAPDLDNSGSLTLILSWSGRKQVLLGKRCKLLRKRSFTIPGSGAVQDGCR